MTDSKPRFVGLRATIAAFAIAYAVAALAILATATPSQGRLTTYGVTASASLDTQPLGRAPSP